MSRCIEPPKKKTYVWLKSTFRVLTLCMETHLILGVFLGFLFCFVLHLISEGI